MTAVDFPDQDYAYIGPERAAADFWHITRNILAREKVLYEGYAVAAVAASDAATAARACALIEVDYEILPNVIDVDDAMADDAPLLFKDMITRGVEPAPTKPSNVAKVLTFEIGYIAAGFAEADEIVKKLSRQPLFTKATSNRMRAWRDTVPAAKGRFEAPAWVTLSCAA